VPTPSEFGRYNEASGGTLSSLLRRASEQRLTPRPDPPRTIDVRFGACRHVTAFKAGVSSRSCHPRSIAHAVHPRGTVNLHPPIRQVDAIPASSRSASVATRARWRCSTGRRMRRENARNQRWPSIITDAQPFLKYSEGDFAPDFRLATGKPILAPLPARRAARAHCSG